MIKNGMIAQNDEFKAAVSLKLMPYFYELG